MRPMLFGTLACATLLAMMQKTTAAEFEPVYFEGSHPSIRMQVIGTYRGGFFSATATQTPPAFDPGTKRLYAISIIRQVIDVLDVRDPYNPKKIFGITDPTGQLGKPTSLAFNRGLLAVALKDLQDVGGDGRIVLGDADGNILVGPLPIGVDPSMLKFTPDGQRIIVANLGEASEDYSIDPEASVSVITLNRHSQTGNPVIENIDFRAFNSRVDELRRGGVRIYGPNATVAQDLEPESVTISADSRTAWLTLERNNAIAVVDLDAKQVEKIIPLGAKDHGQPINGIDTSDRDGLVDIRPWPGLFSFYEPDGIAAYSVSGSTYLVMANEGDPRDFTGFSEETRVAELSLDASAFPDPSIKRDEDLGRLRVSRLEGDLDGDGDFDRLYAFGSRSFSIRKPNGRLVFDSKDAFEKITAAAVPEFFNTPPDSRTFDERSDDRGPEPEQLATGRVGLRTYAFFAFEGIGGVIVYDITQPHKPEFQLYINNRNFAIDPGAVCVKNAPQSVHPDCEKIGDLEPEGVLFIPKSQSPIDVPLLVVTHEASDSVTIFRIDRIGD